MSVCLSVCQREYLRNHTRNLYPIFVYVAYGRGSVLLWQGDEISREGAILGVFFPIDYALYIIIIIIIIIITMVFLKWPKQQRHIEDHYSQSKYEQYQSVFLTAAE